MCLHQLKEGEWKEARSFRQQSLPIGLHWTDVIERNKVWSPQQAQEWFTAVAQLLRLEGPGPLWSIQLSNTSVESFAIEDQDKYLRQARMPVLSEIHKIKLLCIYSVHKQSETFKKTTLPKKWS